MKKALREIKRRPIPITCIQFTCRTADFSVSTLYCLVLGIGEVIRTESFHGVNTNYHDFLWCRSQTLPIWLQIKAAGRDSLKIYSYDSKQLSSGCSSASRALNPQQTVCVFQPWKQLFFFFFFKIKVTVVVQTDRISSSLLFGTARHQNSASLGGARLCDGHATKTPENDGQLKNERRRLDSVKTCKMNLVYIRHQREREREGGFLLWAVLISLSWGRKLARRTRTLQKQMITAKKYWFSCCSC